MELDFTDIAAIIQENESKKESLFGYYNPNTGEGSPIEREALFWDDENFILIPKLMADLPIVRQIIRVCLNLLPKFFVRHFYSFFRPENRNL